MSINTLDLKADQGSTWRRSLTIKDETGTPKDITGHTFRGMVRQRYEDKSPLFSFTFTITDALNGVVEMLLPANFYPSVMSSTITGVYDVELVYPGGEVERLFGGKFTIYPEATR